MPAAPERIPVLKTYKLYIAGRFVRSESGRAFPVVDVKSGRAIANCCGASRKDVRDAVSAARAAFPGWRDTSAYLKGQILYRMAEMLEGRAGELADEIRRGAGIGRTAARREVDASIDRLVHLAGWTDKISQIFGTVNPVASPHFSFSVPEPTGVVGVVCPDLPPLLPLVTLSGRAILGGNTVVVVASRQAPLAGAVFAEIAATGDLPAGVLNLLTGGLDDLAPTLATHMDVNAVVDATGDPDVERMLRAGTAGNLKRIHVERCAMQRGGWLGPSATDPLRILDTTEIKTTWHPIRA